MYDISRSEIKKKSIGSCKSYAEFEKEIKIIEKKHDLHRVKFMKMLVQNIPGSKQRLEFSGVFRTLKIPYLRIFRREICAVYLQFPRDWSLGVTIYDGKYYPMIKKTLQDYDKKNKSNSSIFREYE